TSRTCASTRTRLLSAPGHRHDERRTPGRAPGPRSAGLDRDAFRRRRSLDDRDGDFENSRFVRGGRLRSVGAFRQQRAALEPAVVELRAAFLLPLVATLGANGQPVVLDLDADV